MNTPESNMLAAGRNVIATEAAALRTLAERLDASFVAAAQLIQRASGRVIVSGIGKSGIIARKIAATLTSTGTPATFLHPVEGLHGDLGIVGRDDVAILLSKSGETSELEGLVDYLLRLGVPIIALTGNPGSSLARHAQITLDCSVTEEACPMDLAPTSSTTAALAMGDALAVVVLESRGFKPEDFARYHPGGSLGRRLSIRVQDVMVRNNVPSLPITAVMRETVVPIAEHRGTVAIVDQDRRVAGVVTAGDLTRLMERSPEHWAHAPVTEAMTPSPMVAHAHERGAAVIHRMETRGIMALPVVDEEGRIEGMVHLHDLMRSGVV